MPKLQLTLVKDTYVVKREKEICHDANNLLSTFPDSKGKSRVYTKEELKKNGRPHKGKWR